MLLCLTLLLGACTSGYEAPIEDEPVETAPTQPAPLQHAHADINTANTYVIQSGDTLFSIAWRNKLDFKDIARWNGIAPPYRIYVGKRLRLAPPGSDSKPRQNTKRITKPSDESTPRTAASNKGTNAPSGVNQNLSTNKSSTDAANNVEIHWQWPARGKYEPADSLVGERGINIFATRGTPIVAAASGRVVYSGSGLVGYGKLIIIEHNDTYLSAYAHNDKLLVAEGARVIGGQEIAEMGNTGTRRVMLHFEIRRNGKPVPPLQFLP
ncbi:MAG: peptidoglycan DD-metalloendopeptidase family protein [Gammaproteobacteria bacterium]